jgi:uncharacterized Fe-S cluster protein YjdI
MEREYSNGEVTVVWRPGRCVHSTICFNGLPEVFQPSERPWVKVYNSTTEKIIEQVKKCPSGALSYYLNNDKKEPLDAKEIVFGNIIKGDELKIEILKNGPILVKGKSILIYPDGTEQVKTSYALCRCGSSKNKPFCDGSHLSNGFKG